MARKGETTYTARHDGKTWTRTSHRVYTFAVVARHDKATDERRGRNEWTADERKNLAKELPLENAGRAQIHRPPFKLAEYLRYRAGYYAREYLDKPDRYEWGAFHWAGTRKLADGYARTLRNRGFEVVIVPAEKPSEVPNVPQAPTVPPEVHGRVPRRRTRQAGPAAVLPELDRPAPPVGVAAPTAPAGRETGGLPPESDVPHGPAAAEGGGGVKPAHPLDVIEAELKLIAAGERELKRQSMTFQRDAKLEVAAHYGLAFAAVDLPYPEWAALRDKYEAETGNKL